MRTGLFLAEAATMIPSIGLHDTFLTGIEYNILYTYSNHCLMLFGLHKSIGHGHYFHITARP